MKINFLILFSCFSFTCVCQDKMQCPISIADSTFVNIQDYSQDFILDMKYATNDNFLKTKVYECQSCFLRLKTVMALVKANKWFIKRGYKIKLFDCYRPLDVQKKMFAIVPNPKYVANPAKGSVHNRGGAVDITLVDKKNIEVDMGTTFDFFGPEAAHDFQNFDKKIIENRKFLKKGMQKANFGAIESEWWHYNLQGSKKDALSNFTWTCD